MPRRLHRRRSWTAWVTAAVVVAIAAVVVPRVGPDGDGTETPPTPSVAPPAPAPSPTSTAPAAPATAPAVTIAPPDVVDLGSGVAFTVPAGSTRQPVADGVEITDGTVRLFARVVPAGADPLVVVQSYVAGFDATFAAVNYTPVLTRPAQADGTDGLVVDYAAMDADGTGRVGSIDVVRRADGLVLLTDLAAAVGASSLGTGAAAAAVELASAFTAAPQAAPTAPGGALVPTRLTSVHPAATVDGLVAVSPPPGWVVDLPGPGRVVMSRADGQRIIVTRLATAPDPAVALASAGGDLATLIPGATVAPLGPAREDGAVLSYDATFSADVGGVVHDGTMKVWFDTRTGAVFTAVAHRPAGSAWPGAELAFVLDPLDVSIRGLR